MSIGAFEGPQFAEWRYTHVAYGTVLHVRCEQEAAATRDATRRCPEASPTPQVCSAFHGVCRPRVRSATPIHGVPAVLSHARYAATPFQPRHVNAMLHIYDSTCRSRLFTVPAAL